MQMKKCTGPGIKKGKGFLGLPGTSEYSAGGLPAQQPTHGGFLTCVGLTQPLVMGEPVNLQPLFLLLPPYPLTLPLIL